MTEAEWRRLWAAVRRDLDRALALLPSPPAENEGSVARLSEWLDHNELELAVDELAGCGQTACRTSGMRCRERSSREHRRFSCGQRPRRDFVHGLLELLGEDNAALPPYWEELWSAAKSMGLTEHQARLGRRAAPDAAADGGGG
jgi:hypothetical protein